MNHQEIIDEVSDQLRDTKIATKITRWLNLVLVELGAKYVFKVLHKYDTKPTINGDPDITLATDFHLIKHVEIVAEQRILNPTEDLRIAWSDPEYRVKKGTSEWYYMSGPQKMGLYQVPDSVKDVHYAYQRRIATLPGVDLVTESPELPLEWHPYIVNEILIRGYSYEGNQVQLAECEGKRKRMIKELKPILYRNLQQKHVLEAESRSGRLPRPQLPSNFPRIW